MGSRVACVNLGIGALDAALAKHVLETARDGGVGTELSL
jgi:ornithine cyclodeaminase/alanine dehydrogenase-like protein (mu-crystallin family)